MATCTTPLYAQNWELGTTLGGSVYDGDISVVYSTAANQMRFGGGIFARRRLNRLLALRLQVNAGQLFADEKRFGSSEWKKKRGFSFASPIYELAILPEIRPITIKNVEFIGFLGFALAGFNPKTDYNEPSPVVNAVPNIADRINEDKKANFPRLTFAIPMGGGFQWFVNDRFALGGEVGGRKTFSDYFDQISIVGNPKSKDYYFFGGLTFSYFFGNSNSFSNNWGHNTQTKSGGVSCPTF
ncbi:MAG: DUF6089 family protein [Saprospiraceae bacterium]|nr:DUF6089 family protein [Saprospiraceae bacterium]